VVAVDVTADSTAGFGASCFVHPAKATASTRTAMIAEIFFIFIHPLLSRGYNCSTFTAIIRTG
jgi:hypothetical protein